MVKQGCVVEYIYIHPFTEGGNSLLHFTAFSSASFSEIHTSGGYQSDQYIVDEVDAIVVINIELLIPPILNTHPVAIIIRTNSTFLKIRKNGGHERVHQIQAKPNSLYTG